MISLLDMCFHECLWVYGNVYTLLKQINLSVIDMFRTQTVFFKCVPLLRVILMPHVFKEINPFLMY